MGTGKTQKSVFNKPFRWFWCLVRFENHGAEEGNCLTGSLADIIALSDIDQSWALAWQVRSWSVSVRGEYSTGSWGVVRGPHYQVYAMEWMRWHCQLIYLHEGPEDSGMSSPFSLLRHLHDKRKFSWKCVCWTVTFIIYWHQNLKAQSIHQSLSTHTTMQQVVTGTCSVSGAMRCRVQWERVTRYINTYCISVTSPRREHNSHRSV